MRGFGGIVLGVAAVTALILSTWAHFYAPCSVYRYSAVKDVPARCLMHK
jgi:hypothetical protein